MCVIIFMGKYKVTKGKVLIQSNYREKIPNLYKYIKGHRFKSS